MGWGEKQGPLIPGFNWETFSEYQHNTELEVDPPLPSEIYDQYADVEMFGERPELLPEELRKQVEFSNDVIVKAKEIMAEMPWQYDERSLQDLDAIFQLARDIVVEENGALEQ